MSATNNVELLLITIVLCALFLAAIALLIEALLVVSKIRRLVKKAEHLINNVESASEAIRHMSTASKSRFPLLSLISNLFSSSTKDK